MGKASLWLAIALLAVGGQGCTPRAWYEGLQERQRQDCYTNPNQGEVQKCLERVNATTYDDYSKNRDAKKTGER